MLCDGVNKDKLGLIGRRPDEMLNYLHIQAKPLYRGPLVRMLQGGPATKQSLPLTSPLRVPPALTVASHPSFSSACFFHQTTSRAACFDSS